MEADAARNRLASCGLPQAWAQQPTWTILDTDFQNGQAFLQVWQAWRQDPLRPRMLHYVGIAVLPPAVDSLAATANADLQALAQTLAAPCQGLVAGFRRILLEGGRLSLTLCVGTPHAMLSEQAFQADTLFACAPKDKWTAQLLARRCKRGTRFCMSRPESDASEEAADDAQALLTHAGFQWLPTARFDPHWSLVHSRNPPRHPAPAVGRCAIVGAGISGASVARALALRGWQVTVFDQENAAARGASGLPAGLAVPHVSADDSPRSRLSRSGTHLMAQHAEHSLRREHDWEPSGVLERKPGMPPLWHPQAAWIKPAPLVQAWLAEPGIVFTGNTQVAALRRTQGQWTLFDTQDRALGAFETVVLANAMGCTKLLQGTLGDASPAAELQDKLAALQAVHGTLSHGLYAEALPDLPATPLNGHGCFLPHIPGDAGEQWLVGSTFETDPMAAADIWSQHSRNMAHLPHLLPETGAELALSLERGPVSLWSSTRCVTHDRLPLVGPVDTDSQDGLWLCVGMGARGLSFAALCAELLVARLGAEPLPMEVSLARSLDVHRVRRKRPAVRSFEAGPPLAAG